MCWKNNGEYLAVKVDRYAKSKKNSDTGFELFLIQVLEIENENDKIIAFTWEPKGHKFELYQFMSFKLWQQPSILWPPMLC